MFASSTSTTPFVNLQLVAHSFECLSSSIPSPKVFLLSTSQTIYSLHFLFDFFNAVYDYINLLVIIFAALLNISAIVPTSLYLTTGTPIALQFRRHSTILNMGKSIDSICYNCCLPLYSTSRESCSGQQTVYCNVAIKFVFMNNFKHCYSIGFFIWIVYGIVDIPVYLETFLIALDYII